MDFTEAAQAFGGGFRSNVALRRSEHLVPHHELADSGGAQERRIKVRVQMPFRMRRAVGRRLMEAHRVGEECFEEVVVPGCDSLKDVGEAVAFVRLKRYKIPHMSLGKHEHFKRPHRPERYKSDEVLVLANDAFAFAAFQGEIVAQ